MPWDTGRMVRPAMNPFDQQQQQTIRQLSGMGAAAAPIQNYSTFNYPNSGFGSGVTIQQQGSPSSNAIASFANLAPGTTSPGAGNNASVPIGTPPPPPPVASPTPAAPRQDANGAVGSGIGDVGWWQAIRALQPQGTTIPAWLGGGTGNAPLANAVQTVAGQPPMPPAHQPHGGPPIAPPVGSTVISNRRPPSPV